VTADQAFNIPILIFLPSLLDLREHPRTHPLPGTLREVIECRLYLETLLEFIRNPFPQSTCERALTVEERRIDERKPER
jgi:hypothetical protein